MAMNNRYLIPLAIRSDSVCRGKEQQSAKTFSTPPRLSSQPSKPSLVGKGFRNSHLHCHSLQRRQHNSLDPFLVPSESDSDNPPSLPPPRPILLYARRLYYAASIRPAHDELKDMSFGRHLTRGRLNLRRKKRYLKNETRREKLPNTVSGT